MLFAVDVGCSCCAVMFCCSALPLKLLWALFRQSPSGGGRLLFIPCNVWADSHQGMKTLRQSLMPNLLCCWCSANFENNCHLLCFYYKWMNEWMSAEVKWMVKLTSDRRQSRIYNFILIYHGKLTLILMELSALSVSDWTNPMLEVDMVG